MSTTRVNLDVTQYVRVTSEPFTPSSLLLQSHRDTVRIAFSDVKPARDNTVFHELGGDNEPLDIPFTEVAAWALAMTDRSALTVTQQRSTVEISDRGGIGQSVYLNDQTTKVLQLPFLQTLDETVTLGAPTTINSRVIQLSTGDAAKVQPGNVIEIADDDNTFYQAYVLSVDVGNDTVTARDLMNHTYPVTSTVIISNDDLSKVDGSGSGYVEFKVKPLPNQSGDITRVIVGIQGPNEMDFSQFGSDDPLPVGLLLRVLRDDGQYENIATFTSNGTFVTRGFDHVFQTPKGGNSTHGFAARVTFAGQSKHGVVIRLDGNLNEELQLVVQDNLSAGSNSSIMMIAEGHELQE